jgi:hypothetical protein
MIVANPRWEQFAQRVASGESATAAYRATYKAPCKSAEAHGCRLVRNGKVSARIAEIQQAAATTAVMSLQEKREFLAAIGRTPIGEVDEHSPLCQHIHRTKTRLRVTMPGKLQAIMLDARLAGELRGDSAPVKPTAVAGGYVMTEEQRLKIIALHRAEIEQMQAEERAQAGGSLGNGGRVITEERLRELQALKQQAIEWQSASMALEQPRTAGLTNGA